MTMQNNTTLTALKKTIHEDSSPVQSDIKSSFYTKEGFALMQRVASLLASSSIVPLQYQALIIKRDKQGNIVKEEKNSSAESNCVVALNMAQRMNADPLMIMQNLYIIEGRPAWSSQFIISSLNSCGKYSPLRFKLEKLGEKKIEYLETSWENNKPSYTTKTLTIQDVSCVAWALEKKTGEVLESPTISIEMAAKEGWYSKKGSKWKAMPEVMLRYRAASFFGKLYAPELLMGLQTAEEVEDSTYELELSKEGHYTVTVDTLKNNSENKETNTASKNQSTKKLTSSLPKKEKVEERSNGFLIVCPNNGKQVDEIDCSSKPCRSGCPAFEE